MPDPYPTVVARLAAIRATQAREEAEVHAWYAEQRAAAGVAVERAAAAVTAAATGVADAEADVARVDRAAHDVWAAVGNRLPWRETVRRGPVPRPAPEGAQPGDNADRLLER